MFGQGNAAGCPFKKALKPGRKRELVDKLLGSDWKVSIRRACATLQIDRALYVYKSKRGDQADLKHRIKSICETRVRHGCRRVHVLLRRDGWSVNVKRIYRLSKSGAIHKVSLRLRSIWNGMLPSEVYALSGATPMLNREKTRERAHQLWEAAGKPEGQEERFWHEAERQLKEDQIKHETKTPDNL